MISTININNKGTNDIIESINYCFSNRIDLQSLKIIHDVLEDMNLSEPNINTVMFLFAATCAKHYKYGYCAAHKG